MKNLINETLTTGACFFFALFFFSAAPAGGQAPEGGDLTPLDESQFSNNPDQNPDEMSEAEEESGIKAAVIEGVQISSEPGDRPDEKVISCYFIFRDKPSSYFYDVKLKEKKIIFEFNDTRASAAPVPSVAEAPIKGFTIEQQQVDVNKDVKGLRPEFHNLIRVIFSCDAIPKINVNDEYNVISFNYKWTTDPEKQDKYVLKPARILPYFLVGGGVLGGGGVAAYFLLKPKPEPGDQPLDISDLPVHRQ